jgi:hypothetical protein
VARVVEACAGCCDACDGRESQQTQRVSDLRLGLGEQSTRARRGSVRGTAKTPAFVYHVRGFVAATLMAEFNITVDVVSDTI